MLDVDAFLNGAEWIIDAPFRLPWIQGAFIKSHCSLLVVVRHSDGQSIILRVTCTSTRCSWLSGVLRVIGERRVYREVMWQACVGLCADRNRINVWRSITHALWWSTSQVRL